MREIGPRPGETAETDKLIVFGQGWQIGMGEGQVVEVLLELSDKVVPMVVFLGRGEPRSRVDAQRGRAGDRGMLYLAKAASEKQAGVLINEWFLPSGMYVTSERHDGMDL